MHSERRAAIDEGLARRQIELLVAIAAACDADVDDTAQCRQCGDWFKSVAQHRPHCDGP